MQLSKSLLATLLVFCGSAAIADPPLPARTVLRSVTLDTAKPVVRVETSRMDFLPGQRMPAHLHKVPAICFVTKGALLVSIGDAPEQKMSSGSVTYEAVGVPVHYFQNASKDSPAQLNCVALLGAGETTARVMLDEKPPK